MQAAKNKWMIFSSVLAFAIVIIIAIYFIASNNYEKKCAQNLNTTKDDISALASFKFFDIMSKIN